jgi:hypothetical protein
MSLTVRDLITAIQSQLESGVTNRYCAVGTVHPGQPPITNPSESLCDLTSTELTNAIGNAVIGKWRTEVGSSGGLRIKGAEMVKRTTGLEPTEPD